MQIGNASNLTALYKELKKPNKQKHYKEVTNVNHCDIYLDAYFINRILEVPSQ